MSCKDFFSWIFSLFFLFFLLVGADWLLGPYLFPYPKISDLPATQPTVFFSPEHIDPPPRDILLMGFSAPPGITFYGTKINELGFTGKVPAIPKPVGTARILTLGGSAFFNRNVGDRLSNKLDELMLKDTNLNSSRAEVLGGALQRHTTRASLLKFKALQRYGFDQENGFDFVVVYHGINDLWANNVPKKQFRADYAQLDPWYRHNILLDNSLILRKIYNSWIYPLFYSAQDDVGYPNKEHENQSNFASEKTFEKNIQQLIDDVKQSGGTPVLLTFAWYIPPQYTYELFDKGELGYNNPDKYNQTPVEMWGSIAYVNEGIARHNAVTRQLALKNHVPLLDMEKFIGDDADKFGDVCHLSDSGTQYMVDMLAAFLIEQMKSPDIGKQH
jgi:lysophospholipase L1-like esterase